jgi:hypothetical protein
MQRNGQGEHGVLYGRSVADVLPPFEGIIDTGEMFVDGTARQGNAKLVGRAFD